MILDDIIAKKRADIEKKKKEFPVSMLKETEFFSSDPRTFLKKSAGKVQLIAELKKASPSKGLIRADFDPVLLAKICQDNGAAALSVLTEEHFFLGRLEYLSEVKKAVTIPLLRKDFILDEYQIWESRAYGADAVLLLASALDQTKLNDFLNLTHDLGMSALVEFHSEDEITGAAVSPRIFGINNRDLKTFTVDIKTTERLVKKVPADKIIVSESGIFTAEDIRYLSGLGVDAALIGEAIMSAADIAGKVKELSNV